MAMIPAKTVLLACLLQASSAAISPNLNPFGALAPSDARPRNLAELMFSPSKLTLQDVAGHGMLLHHDQVLAKQAARQMVESDDPLFERSMLANHAVSAAMQPVDATKLSILSGSSVVLPHYKSFELGEDHMRPFEYSAHSLESAMGAHGIELDIARGVGPQVAPPTAALAAKLQPPHASALRSTTAASTSRQSTLAATSAEGSASGAALKEALKKKKKKKSGAALKEALKTAGTNGLRQRPSALAVPVARHALAAQPTDRAALRVAALTSQVFSDLRRADHAAEALESFAKDKGEALSASARTPSMLAAAPLVATVPYYLHWASKPS